MLLGLHKYSVSKPINCHRPSHKYYYYIPHIIQLQFSTKYAHHITTKIGPQNYTIPTQSPTSFGLWAKIKKSPNFKSLTTMWLIPKSHYDVTNSMSHYDVANLKPDTMRHYLQSPLLHNTLKPVTIQQYFTKSQNHFYKTQILIWHLLFTKPKY